MMDCRHWVRLFAVLGVLLHGGMHARLNAIVLAAASDSPALTDAAVAAADPQFGVICGHSDGRRHPGAPLPDSDCGACCTCEGMTGALGLAPALLKLDFSRQMRAAEFAHLQGHDFGGRARLWPPNRGPPILPA